METQKVADIDITDVPDSELSVSATAPINEITGLRKTVKVKLPSKHRDAVKGVIRLGRREAMENVKTTDEDLVKECELPKTFDSTLQTIVKARGPNVTLSGIEISCLWNAYVSAVKCGPMDETASTRYLNSTIIRADMALVKHVEEK